MKHILFFSNIPFLIRISRVFRISIISIIIFLFALFFFFPSNSTAQNLWSMTEFGGAYDYDPAGSGDWGQGVLFNYIPGTSVYSDKYDFNSTSNGWRPLGSLLYASDGNMYGMASAGGPSGAGVIFKYTLPGGPYSVIYNFTGYFGNTVWGNPFGTLMQASDGFLYGTTMSGGSGLPSGCGVLFKCSLGGAFTKLVDFTGATGPNDGQAASGTLLQANDGNLYGMTCYGGANDKGVLYKYNLTTSTYTKLFDFTGISGAYPGWAGYGRLTQASDGLLYGMTFNGGASNYGVLFQYNIATGAYVDKFDFLTSGPSGYSPLGFLIQATDGNMYGLASRGGTYNEGNIFQYTLSGSFTPLYQFNSGYNYKGYPFGSLLQASDGNMYGMFQGQQGQVSSWSPYTLANGGIFKYTLSPSTYNEIYTFDGTHGANPEFATLIDICQPTIIGPVTACQGSTGNVYTTQPGMTPYAWSISGGSITAGGGTGNNTATVTWGTSGTNTINVSYTNGTGCGTANRTTVFNVKVNPTSVSGGTASASPNPVCYGYNTILSVSGNTAGTTVQWQSSSNISFSSPVALGMGSPYTTTGGVTATTYYRAIVSSGTCASATTAAVTVTVSTLATASISYIGTPYCSNSSTVTVNRTGTTGGTYSSSPSGLTIDAATGTVTPGTSTANAYSVTYTIGASGGCPAVYAITPVTISLLPTAPTSPALTDANNFCSNAGGTLNLSAAGGSGTSLQWYSGGCGSGTTIGSGTPFNISEPTVTTTYYARWESAGCANSTCAPVTVTVITAPTAPASASTDANNFYSNAGGTLNLSATGGSGTTLQWYSGGCGSGTTIGSGSPLNIPKPTASTTYYARWETVGCTSSSCVPVPVTVLPPTTPLNVGVAINTAGDPADKCAIFDVSSTAQGMLIPRMTTAQRDAIYSPINSLLIFNTTTQCFEAYKASTSTWVTFGCL